MGRVREGEGVSKEEGRGKTQPFVFDFPKPLGWETGLGSLISPFGKVRTPCDGAA